MIGLAGFMAAPKEKPADRDWLEDAKHENGNYECRCHQCGMFFIGHKRRVTCKACAAKN